MKKMILVKDWMKKKVLTIKENAHATDAIKLMLKHKISVVPVVSKDSIVGLISDRLLLKAALQDISKVRVKDVMSKGVLTVEPTISVSTAFRSMNKKKVKHAPVVKDDKLVGIITVRDVIKKVSNV